MTSSVPTLLCVANYPSNTGYAWDYIEGLFGGLSDRLASRGVRTLVAYPEMPARSQRPLRSCGVRGYASST
jgi:hypothetical protein